MATYTTHNLERIMTDEPYALQFISQCVRGHKVPPMEYDQDAFWRDFDIHLNVFHETNRQRKFSSATQVGSSSIQGEDAQLLRHVKVLKRGRPGSAKYRAAIKALDLRQESKANTSKAKATTGDPKERSGVCFGFRDKRECKYGSKC